MAVVDSRPGELLDDGRRRELHRLMRAANRAAGVPDQPELTLDEVLSAQVARGIRPEDNAASRELIRLRYGEGR